MSHLPGRAAVAAAVAFATTLYSTTLAAPLEAQQNPAQNPPAARPGGGAAQPPSEPILLPHPANMGNAAQLADIRSSIREFMIGPEYSAAVDSAVPASVPRGTIHRFVMRSVDSRIYPSAPPPRNSADHMPVTFERNVAVYIPAGYVAGSEVPFMVVQDGVRSYMDRVTPVLDNLIRQRRIPPIVGVFVDPGPGDGPGSQRGREYDNMTRDYVDFIETEVLPRITADYGVRFTSDPEGRAAFGGSSGAAAALTMAWFRPDLYRKVLSYSGTFVDQQRYATSIYPHGAWEYHENLIPKSDPKPIRIWLHVSDGDNGNTRADDTHGNWVLANQHMLEGLRSKGYDYRYVFSLDSRHTDRRVIGQTLPAALEWLWAGYPR